MEEVGAKIAEIVKAEFGIEVVPVLSFPDSKFGDFATNVALQLSKELKRSPREIADKIVELLKTQGLKLDLDDNIATNEI
jgi:arginyl-tRNA synthetase